MLSSDRLRVLRLVVMVGPTSATLNQFTLPARDCHDVTMVSYHRPEASDVQGVRVLDGNGSVWGYLRTLAHLLRRERFDVVHVHASTVGLLFVCCALSLGLVSLLRRTLYTVHSSSYSISFRNWLLMLGCFALLPRVVFCGEASRASFFRWVHFLLGNRERTIPNGADLGRVRRALAQRSSISGDNVRFRAITVGRLTRGKDPSTVLQACSRALGSQDELVIVGDGPEAERLAQEAEQASGSLKIRLTGVIPRDKVFALLSSSNMFLSASHSEGIPIAVLEAMAAGCPVLLSAIPAHMEVASGCQQISLFPPGDVAALAQGIERLLAMPESSRKAIGESCRRVVTEKFSLETMLKRYDAEFRSLARLGGRATESRQ